MRRVAIDRGRPMAVAVVASVVVYTVLIHAGVGSSYATLAFDNVGQFAAALFGAAACGWRSRRSRGRLRLSWALIGASLACWASGQAVWVYYDMVAQREVPFPSVADVGFLLMPALALPGLLVRPSAALRGRARLRVLLDGIMVAGSLYTVSWATSLGAAYHQGAADPFALTVSLAYPVTDIVMITIAVSVLAHARVRAGLPLLVLGLVALSVADSGFIYFAAIGKYTGVSFPDSAWFAAFVLIGVAALSPSEGRAAARHVDEEAAPSEQLESPVFAALPYVAVTFGFAAQVSLYLGGRANTTTVIVQALAVLALITRQLLTVRDNRRMAANILAQQEELRFRAFHDGLTGLANRALFTDRVVHALELHRRDGRGVSVVYCDLDDFKSVNDSFGHDSGDRLLIEVGRRLNSTARGGDTVARLGGDEFAVLCEGDVDAESLGVRLLGALAEPIELAGRLVSARASVGTASLRPGDETISSEQLLKWADLAMYAAKQAGKSVCVAYNSTMALSGTTDLEERLALVDDVRGQRLRVAVQPIMSPDGAIIACEALARWHHNGVAVPPDRFIPLAETAGVLPELDLLVARRALEYVATSDGAHAVSINVALPTLRDPGLPDRLIALLRELKVEPSKLIVEVPETHEIGDTEILVVLTRLREAGMRIAIDDFGVGYSNLARLASLAPDIIKFDKSLIDPLTSSVLAARIVASMIDLAHDLGAVVIAEGVEYREQCGMLIELGCDAQQGYLLGRPTIPARSAAVAQASHSLSA